MQKNHAFSVGSVDEVVTEANLKAAYGIGVKITSVANEAGRPIKACIPMLAG